MRFRALALRRSESRPANSQNVTFRTSLLWPIHIINSVDKTNLIILQYSPPTQHHRFVTNLPPFSSEKWPVLLVKSHKIEVEVTKLKKTLVDGSVIPKPFCSLSGFFFNPYKNSIEATFSFPTPLRSVVMKQLN